MNLMWSIALAFLTISSLDLRISLHSSNFISSYISSNVAYSFIGYSQAAPIPSHLLAVFRNNGSSDDATPQEAVKDGADNESVNSSETDTKNSTASFISPPILDDIEDSVKLEPEVESSENEVSESSPQNSTETNAKRHLHSRSMVLYSPARFQNPPFRGNRIQGVKIDSWAKVDSNGILLKLYAGGGGIGAVSSRKLGSNQAACAKLYFPSWSYS